MAKTTVYFIRHGQSEANRLHMMIGHTDMDLTELGHAQAEATAEYLKDIPADVIYSSDLLRAYNTALHTAQKKGMEVIPWEGLREQYVGDWEGKLFDDLPTLFPETFPLWRTDVGLSASDNGESVAQLQARISAAIAELVRRHEGKTLFLFSHATPIRSMATLWQGHSLDRMKDLPWPANASVTVAEYENGVGRLLEYGYSPYL